MICMHYEKYEINTCMANITWTGPCGILTCKCYISILASSAEVICRGETSTLNIPAFLVSLYIEKTDPFINRLYFIPKLYISEVSADNRTSLFFLQILFGLVLQWKKRILLHPIFGKSALFVCLFVFIYWNLTSSM